MNNNKQMFQEIMEALRGKRDLQRTSNNSKYSDFWFKISSVLYNIAIVFDFFALINYRAAEESGNRCGDDRWVQGLGEN